MSDERSLGVRCPAYWKCKHGVGCCERGYMTEEERKRDIEQHYEVLATMRTRPLRTDGS